MSLVDNAIEQHINNGCFAKFTKTDKFGILEIPKNIISKKSAQKCVYEIDGTKVNIYIDGIKERSIECPLYACRPLIMIDMVFRMTFMGLTPFLLKVLNGNEDIPLHEIIQTKSAANILDAPESKKDKKLEDKLYTVLENSYETGQKDLIPENVSEGFEIIQKHYNGELNATI